MRVTGIVPRLILALVAGLLLGLPVSAQQADADALKKQALELNNITGDDAINGKITSLVENAAETKKLLEVAQGMAKEKEQPFNSNALHILSQVAQQLKDREAAVVFFRAYATQAAKLGGGRQGEALLELISLLLREKKYDEAVKVCQEFLEIQGDEFVTARKPLVLQRMIQAMALQGKTDEALKLVNTLVKAQPSNWLILELKADILYDADKVDEAAKVYEEVLDRIGKDRNLEKEERERYGDLVRYRLSGVYIDLNQVDKAADHLKALLAKDPNNPTYNNDLGYIWADHDMNLDEAEKMIRKAIDDDRKLRKEKNPNAKPEEDKDNASYIDSLGWVLYKKKQYKEARDYLKQAVELPRGQNVEIYDHLGDAHMKLGEKEEAIAAWKKGIEAAGTSKREQQRKAEVEKKVKDNQ